ncbi:unnamed protein product [marine sediment metagenome]|uniref:Uncharacterized protein n=1 Tax=marine sediment metagenome TaxID=412755 RepID=X1CG88_9ZZZZ
MARSLSELISEEILDRAVEIFKPALEKIMKLEPHKKVVYAQTVGYSKK